MIARVLLGSILLSAAAPAPAPTPYVIDARAAATTFARAHQLCTADGGRLWGVSLCGPMMFVDPQTHQAVANVALDGATLDGSVYRFNAPQDVGAANTSIDFQGQRWVMILWPPPADADSLSVMLMHESYHRIQPVLHLEGGGGLGVNGHLDSEAGRIWLRVEIHALQAALAASGDARLAALQDAVAVALYRRSLFPDAAEQERGLTVNEGVAESTGIDAGLPPERRIAYTLQDLAMTETSPSYVRSYPYGLGPAYVELMDARKPDWRRGVNDASDLMLMTAAIYGIDAAPPTTAQAQSIASRHGGAQIVAEEDARTKRLASVQARYTAEFVNGPVLILPMKKFHITFSPRDVEQFGNHGSIYHVLQLSDAWGMLKVNGGDALISNGFDSVEIPRGTDPAAGKGWTLQLDPHFTLAPVDGAANATTVRAAPTP